MGCTSQKIEERSNGEVLGKVVTINVVTDEHHFGKARNQFKQNHLFLDEPHIILPKKQGSFTPKQQNSTLFSLLHDFKAATCTVGRPFKVSVLGYILLMHPGSSKLKIEQIPRFPFVCIEVDRTTDLGWLVDIWKSLVSEVQALSEDLERVHVKTNSTLFRKVSDANAREILSECLKVSEILAERAVVDSLDRIGAALTLGGQSDQNLIKEVEWSGGFTILF